tara:strand:- start:837 stop:1130 length:294 start_codon:yes stop_codon:yes gene_type:complete
LGLHFFGLTIDIIPEIRKKIFTQIHEIVFHGKGGYDWNTVYNMPIWLRKFTFSRIDEFYQKENQSQQNSHQGKNQQTLVDSSGKVTPPQFQKKSSYK